MKFLIYNIYRRGDAGLSNLMMSLELAVVMAKLTDRVLILAGNNTPVANIVPYASILTNAHPSRVTDLVETPVPWLGEEAVNLAAFAPYDICEKPAWDAVFYYPPTLSFHSEDFLRFAGRRRKFITVDETINSAPAIAMSGGAGADTLSFYSTFFYLDAESQRQAYDVLRAMTPKRAFADLAARVARDIGPFNAVHVRRGDFKKTFGTTTLDRTGRDIVEALEPHFARDDRLVVLTDEADDPVFDDVRSAYADIIFLDHHILRDYRCDFLDLPMHDSIALAYLSQLVAAASQDFVGTMTSTFTSMIQRMRGNHGKEERFKFLWNELPDEGEKVERGRHSTSNSVPLDDGVMVEVHEGPYSWNRANNRLNNAWMREWPESFLCESAMVERARGRDVLARRDDGSCVVSFLGDAVALSSNDPETGRALAALFAPMIAETDVEPVASIRLQAITDGARLLVNGAVVAESSGATRLLRQCYREVVACYVECHPELVWMHAGCAASENGAVILPGDWGRGKTSLVLALCERGWSYFSDDVVPVDAASGKVLPFPATPQKRSPTQANVPRGELGIVPKSPTAVDERLIAKEPRSLSMIVLPHYRRDAPTEFFDISPAEAVGELLESCLSFTKNEDAAIERLCALVETFPVQRLVFDKAAEAAELLIDQLGMAPEPAISASRLYSRSA